MLLAYSSRCQCPIGWGGEACDHFLWSECTTAQGIEEAYCGTWLPKSCGCFRQCAQTICGGPDPGNCDYDFPFDHVKCFERGEPNPAKQKLLDPVQWAGGSDIPEKNELNVTYHRGAFPDRRPPNDQTMDW
jgi:hypothetical protein